MAKSAKSVRPSTKDHCAINARTFGLPLANAYSGFSAIAIRVQASGIATQAVQITKANKPHASGTRKVQEALERASPRASLTKAIVNANTALANVNSCFKASIAS